MRHLVLSFIIDIMGTAIISSGMTYVIMTSVLTPKYNETREYDMMGMMTDST